MSKDKHTEILLTIGVPTYNRCYYLNKNLAAICGQITPDMPVEVLVANNCSSDDTEKIIKEYARTCPALRYHKQEKNIGGSANFRYIWNNGKGRFIWLIGDDDYIAPGSVTYLLEAIKADMNVALLFLQHANEKQIFVGLKGSVQYVQTVSFFDTFISALVIRKDYIDIKRVQDELDNLGLGKTALFQTALSLDAIGKDRGFTLIRNAWFGQGTGESVNITPEQYLHFGRTKGLPDLGAIFVGEYFDILEYYIGDRKDVISEEKKKLLYGFLIRWTALSAQKIVRWGAQGVLEYYNKYYKDEPFYKDGLEKLKPYIDALEKDIKTDTSDLGEQFEELSNGKTTENSNAPSKSVSITSTSPKRPTKLVLLAGGKGLRISEESTYRPKPMVEIGAMPILWHIMKLYSYYGVRDFIICAGYKQYMIKEWFDNYFLYKSDVTFDFTEGKKVILHEQHNEPWRVTVVDTGEDTMTGGRIKRVQKYIGDEPFYMTYGDGVCDVNIEKLTEFHMSHGKLATLTSVLQAPSKGILNISGDYAVRSFREKSQRDSASINAGFMVLEPKVFDYLGGDDCIFEKEPLKRLANDGQLMSYPHTGFWQCMDTLMEKNELETLWKKGEAPWKVWEN